MNISWSTDNIASGDGDSCGGYVQKMVINAHQIGLDLDGSHCHPVNIENLTQLGSSTPSLAKITF